MAQKPAKKFVSIAPFYQTKTPSRNAVFQNPELVALGVAMCKDYETSLAEAIIDHDHRTEEAQMVVLIQRMNAETDARIEAKLRQRITESLKEPVYDDGPFNGAPSASMMISAEIQADIELDRRGLAQMNARFEDDDPRQGDMTVGEYARSLTGADADEAPIHRRVAEYV